MRNRRIIPTDWAWNFVGFGLMCFLIGSAWSVANAKAYQIELAEYKLQVNTALLSVKKVSDTLEQVTNSTAIAPSDRRKINDLTKKSDRILDLVEKNIEEQNDKLINLEIEE